MWSLMTCWSRKQLVEPLGKVNKLQTDDWKLEACRNRHTKTHPPMHLKDIWQWERPDTLDCVEFRSRSAPLWLTSACSLWEQQPRDTEKKKNTNKTTNLWPTRLQSAGQAEGSAGRRHAGGPSALVCGAMTPSSGWKVKNWIETWECSEQSW